MTRITITSPRTTYLGSKKIRLAITDARAERMEMRLTELNLLHDAEVISLQNIFDTVRKQFLERKAG